MALQFFSDVEVHTCGRSDFAPIADFPCSIRLGMLCICILGKRQMEALCLQLLVSFRTIALSYKNLYKYGGLAMEAVAYSTFRKDLRAYLDKTRDDATPLLVTSKDPSANVVVMNAMDYDNLIENLEVQSNARLMSKIERGMKQFAEERGANHELIEVEDAETVVRRCLGRLSLVASRG